MSPLCSFLKTAQRETGLLNLFPLEIAQVEIGQLINVTSHSIIMFWIDQVVFFTDLVCVTRTCSHVCHCDYPAEVIGPNFYSEDGTSHFRASFALVISAPSDSLYNPFSGAFLLCYLQQRSIAMSKGNQ